MGVLTRAVPLAVTGAALIAGSPAVAAGQQAAPGAADIIVTARRVEERLQDVPISITVFNQQQLDNRNVVNAADLATYTPSLSADRRFGSDNSTFAIRGFAQELRTAPSVATYFAEVVGPRAGNPATAGGDGSGPGSFFDLQNVQVLKGPQGTLFGRNTTGGAVLLVPTKPTSKLEGYVEGSIGNYDMRRIQAVLNVPLGDRARLRLGVDRLKREGYADNISGVGPRHFYDTDYVAARASLVLDLTPNLENYTIATYSRSDIAGTVPQVFVCDLPSQLGLIFNGSCEAQLGRSKGRRFWTVENGDPLARSLVGQWQLINKTTWRASDTLTIRNIASYGQYRSAQSASVFGDDFLLPATLFGFPTGALAGRRLTVTQVDTVPGSYVGDQYTLTEEFQLQGRSLGDRLDWQAGVYFEKSEPLSLGDALSSEFASCTDVIAFRCADAIGQIFGNALPIRGGGVAGGGSSERFRNVGVYGQATYALTDRLKLTAGLRYTDDRASGQSTVIVYNFPAPDVPAPSCPSLVTVTLADACRRGARSPSHAPTWLVDVEYKPFESGLLYAKYARGYRQGSVSPLSPPGFNSFGPEHVDSYEAGIKTSFASAIRGTFNVAAFYNKFRDQQIQVAFAALVDNLAEPPASTIVNAGRSRIYGAEAESSISPLKGFRLDASYAYLNTRLNTLDAGGVPAAYTPVFTSLAGFPLPFTPKHKVSATASYTLPLSPGIGAVTVAGTYTYTSRALTAATSPFGFVPKYDLVNLNLNWNAVFGQPFDLSLFVTNVFDRKYVTFVPGAVAFGFEAHTLGEPRMIGGRLKVRFGPS